VAFDCSGFLPLARLSWLLVKLASTHLIEDASLFAGAFKASQRAFQELCFADTNARHRNLEKTMVEEGDEQRVILTQTKVTAKLTQDRTVAGVSALNFAIAAPPDAFWS